MLKYQSTLVSKVFIRIDVCQKKAENSQTLPNKTVMEPSQGLQFYI